VVRTERAEKVLACEPRSAALARRFVDETLESWGWSGADDGVVPLLVSELVTNALLHARTDVRVQVTRPGGRLRIAVEDYGSRKPARRGHTAGSATGRGLDLVEALASEWGVDTVRGGKVVWFELGWPNEESGGSVVESARRSR
jgi:anti-sigma regulatory factor (Ser/Thr protein kinase)